MKGRREEREREKKNNKENERTKFKQRERDRERETETDRQTEAKREIDRYKQPRGTWRENCSATIWRKMQLVCSNPEM